MNTKALFASLSIVVSAALACPAQAAMVAGWDFSQYFTDGLLSTGDETLTDTLPANASNFDPTFGVGSASSNYGTMYINGQFGSTDSPLDLETDPFVPSAAAGGSLVSNINAPVFAANPTSIPFDQCAVLQVEGQQSCNLLTMTALSAASVVFEATPPNSGIDWSLALAGKTLSGVASVGVEFSGNGTDFVSFGSLNLTTLDTLFTVNFGPGQETDNAYVRLSFANPVGGQQAFIDNLAISATVIPEPGTALLLIAGLTGIARFGRRRA